MSSHPRGVLCTWRTGQSSNSSHLAFGKLEGLDHFAYIFCDSSQTFHLGLDTLRTSHIGPHERSLLVLQALSYTCEHVVWNSWHYGMLLNVSLKADKAGASTAELHRASGSFPVKKDASALRRIYFAETITVQYLRLLSLHVEGLRLEVPDFSIARTPKRKTFLIHVTSTTRGLMNLLAIAILP